MSISLHRIARCYYPMQMMKFKKSHAVYTVIAIWVLAFVANIMFISHAPSTMPQFNPSFPLCYFNVEDPTYPLLLKIHLLIFMGTPFNIIIITNVMLLRYSHHMTKDLRKAMKERARESADTAKTFNTIYLISGLLITTWTPLVLIDAIRSFFPGFIRSHHFMRLAGNAFLLSSCGNPFIYCFANPKFKVFCMRLVNKSYSATKASMIETIGGSLAGATPGHVVSKSRVGDTSNIQGKISGRATSSSNQGLPAVGTQQGAERRGRDIDNGASTSDYASFPDDPKRRGSYEGTGA